MRRRVAGWGVAIASVGVGVWRCGLVFVAGCVFAVVLGGALALGALCLWLADFAGPGFWNARRGHPDDADLDSERPSRKRLEVRE